MGKRVREWEEFFAVRPTWGSAADEGVRPIGQAPSANYSANYWMAMVTVLDTPLPMVRTTGTAFPVWTPVGI
jgi:hypothetical protein